ncbi:MAG: hypothetical protein GOMPHAMPRED_006626 [Gomphillus americanus]|uniref:PWI domain-containing protein n=1 Tax=Gomphillus americanus TaxID=1940652 RepID=A0A8H3ITA7_9LECA|nr:MAG: hypothetical protein GOMPHAMPRED_006626 [Gomphillus americanus]
MTSTKDAKLLRQTKFPAEFNQKVDMKKVNVEVMKKWIAGKISEILGNEDDVVIELCFNLLEESRFPDIKDLQIKLTGFLDKDTPKFCKELWNLCLSAQSNAQGVPKELLEAKKMELMQEKIESEKAAEVARKRKETDQARERTIDNMRQNEGNERNRGTGRPFGRDGLNGKASPRGVSRSPPRRYSGSSPPRRREGNYRDWGRRDRDLYVPRGRPDRYDDRRYQRSPSSDRQPSPKRRRRASSPSPPRNNTASYARRKENTRADRVRSRSRSRSRSPPGRGTRKRADLSSTRSRSPPPHRDRRRQSSSSSASEAHPQTHSRSRSPPAKNSSKQVSPPDDTRRNTSSSRSRSRTPKREERKKRHRSLERYAPAATRRRRNTSSSVSEREEKKPRRHQERDGNRDVMDFESARHDD